MKFSELKPALGSGPRVPEGIITWALSFKCPLCGHVTGIAVWPNAPHEPTPVWKITPSPLDMLNSIESDVDLNDQWARIWDRTTISPSMRDLPHPRQVKCSAHFSVIQGQIHL